MDDMVIFTRTYGLLTWLLPCTEKFPRSQRFVVTKLLQDAALDFQETIFWSNSADGRDTTEVFVRDRCASGQIVAVSAAGT